tara:strand:- start:44 stop:247 length:204 start_codon:yes stop_codon:yes gene_type:complete
MSLNERIDARMNALQHWMETNYHMDNPDEVYELTLQISKFWSIMNEADKDYVQVAQDAIKSKTMWST